jgi:hypothetical protein
MLRMLERAYLEHGNKEEALKMLNRVRIAHDSFKQQVEQRGMLQVLEENDFWPYACGSEPSWKDQKMGTLRPR